MKTPRSLHPICDRLHPFVVMPVIAYLLLPLHVLGQAPVSVAPNSGNTRVYTSGSVPVVDIATPNGAGLSHNKFTNYNVPAAGLVLNNAAPNGFTQNTTIAGPVTVNFNLKPGATAGVILNEVVAANPTTIAGFTEVAGAKADVVVANPYGISISGGGFINTDRVTLATGTPVLGSDGSLTTMRVGSGELVVTGTGLNGSNLNYLNLLGRSVRLDGPVHTAGELTVAAGVEDFDLANRTVSTGGAVASGSAPSYAIDSTVVGGLYANQIRLIANEAGVGVRLLGDVAATGGDFTLDANGKVQLSGRAYAERAMKLTGNGVEISGANATVTAKTDVTVAAGNGAVTFTDAAIVAGRDLNVSGASLSDTSSASPTSANRFAVGNVAITVPGLVSVSRSSYGAGGTLAVQGGNATFSNSAVLYSGADTAAAARNLTVRATTGDLDLGNAQISSPTALALTADRGAVRVGASAPGTGILANGNLTVTAATSVNNAGTVVSGGTLAVARTSGVTTDVAVTNSGIMQSAAALTFGNATFNNTSTGSLAGLTVAVNGSSATNAGAIQGAQGVTVNVTGNFTNAANAAILASDTGRNITIDAGTLNNGGFVQSAGNVTLNVSGDATNTGTVLAELASAGGANGTVTVNARTLANSGTVQAPGALALNVGTRFDNAANGAVLGGGNVTVGANSAFNLSNAGRIQATNTLSLGSGTAAVAFQQAASGVTLAGGALRVTGSTLDNAGIVQAGDALTANLTGALTNQQTGAVLTTGSAGKDVTLNAASIANLGQMQSTGAIAIATTGAITNNGTLLTLGTDKGGAARDISVKGDSFTNRGGLQSAGGFDLAVANKTVSTVNSGTLAVSGALAIAAGPQFTNDATGKLIAGGNISVLNGSAGGFTLTNAGAIQSGKDIALGSATQAVTYVGQSGSNVVAAGTLGITGNTLDNAGALQSNGAATLALSGNVTNSGTIATIAAANDGAPAALAVSATSLANTGMVSASGTLAVDTRTTITNSGTLQATDALTLTTPQKLDNSGKVLSTSSVTLRSGGTAFDLANAGNVQAGGDLTIGASAATANLTNAANATLLSSQTVAINASSLNNAGLVQGGRGLNVSATGNLINQKTGTLVTIGTAGSAINIAAASLDNAGIVQSAGALTSNTTGILNNTGTIATTASANGGSNGQLTTNSSTVTNRGVISSAGGLNVKAVSAVAPSVSNFGTMQAARDVTIVAPVGMTNAANALILGGASVTLKSGGGTFAFTNNGTVQSTGALMVGDSVGRVALDNGSMLRGTSSVGLTATTVSNNGTITSSGAVSIGASDRVDNRGTTNGQNVQIDAGSLWNFGTITGTAGVQLTSQVGIYNSGFVQTSGNISLVAPQAITNGGTLIASGNISAQSGAGTFVFQNSGRIQSDNVSIGTTGATANLTNWGSIVSTRAVDLKTTQASNFGTIQVGTFFTLTASGDVTNNDAGRIAAGSVAVTGASLTNSGVIQANGYITSTTTGALTNSGQIATIPVADGGGAGYITTASSNVTNSGTISSASTLAVTATGTTATTVNNTGTIQSVGNTDIVSPNGLTNSSTGKVLVGGNLTVQSGGGGFNVTNAGTVQSGGTMTIGTTAAPVALDNQSTGAINAGSTLSVAASTIANAGAIQSAGALTLNLTGALTNAASGTLMTTGTNTPLTVNAGSLTNAGTVQSSGTLTTTTSGATTNSGSMLTVGSGALSSTGATINNSGTVQSAGTLALTGTANAATTVTNSGKITAVGNTTLLTPGGFNNTAAGKIDSGGTLVLNNGSTAFTVLNSGAIRSAQDFTIGTATGRGNVSNSAGATLLSDAALTARASDFANSGIVQSAGKATLDATGAITNNSGAKLLTTGTTSADILFNGATLTNAGTLQSTNALTGTLTGAATNTGTILTTGSTAGALALTSSTLTNSGTVESGSTMALTENGAAATTLTNTGTIDSVGAMTVNSTGAITNSSAAKLFTTGTTANLTVSATNLTNDGGIQSTGATNATLSGALTNTSTGTMLASGNLTATVSGAVTNNGTVQSGSALTVSAGTTFANNGTGVIKSTGAATLVTGTSLTNAASAKIDAGGALIVRGTSAFTFTNNGLVQSGGNLTVGELARRATVTNAAGATINAGNNLGLVSSSVTNSGLVQSGGSTAITLDSGATLTNNVGAKILSGGNLTIDTASGGFTIANSNLIQSGGLLTIGAVSRLATINQTGTGSKLLTDTFAINAGAISNQGMIMTTGGGTLNATSFTNDGTGSRLLLATDAGTATVTITGALTNNGAIHSGDKLSISAGSITNSATGGISSLGNLTLTSSSDLTNRGALYAGNKMTLTATGSIFNYEDATIDTDGDFAATANNAGSRFLNQGAITIGGTGLITAKSFENVMTGAENLTRQRFQPGAINNGDYIEGVSGDPSPNVSTTKWYYTGHSGFASHGFLGFGDATSNISGFWYSKQLFLRNGSVIDQSIFSGKVKPQISAANLTVTGFDSAQNIGANINATGTLNINGGSSSSTFLNDALALSIQRFSYSAEWSYEYSFFGDYNWWDPNGINSASSNMQYDNTYFSVGSGLRAQNLNFTNVGTLTNLGVTAPVATKTTTASGSATDSLASASNVGAASAGTATRALTAGGTSVSVDRRGAALQIDSVATASIAKSSLAYVTGFASTDVGRTASSASIGLKGGSKSAGLGDVDSASSGGQSLASARSGLAASGPVASTGRVTLGNLSIRLPSNPNGLFVTSPDPQARFRVSSNETFGISSDAVGSDFLAKELGYDADRIQTRLGDPAYETYLVRQQLNDQLGSRFLTGFTNEKDQMKSLMTAGAQSATQLGLVWGQEPTPQQLSRLDRDMVWMVTEVIDGEPVLVPKVYLSAKTRAAFDGGNAAIAGTNVSIEGGNLANTGGTISGSNNLNINVTGDIKNSSGTITGGNVGLKAGGSIINETLTSTNDANKDSNAVLKTGTISATGNLAVDAGKDIKIIGANMSSGGNASLKAGNEIVVDTIQSKQQSVSRSNDGSTTTTVTTSKQVGSNLDFGGNLQLASGKDTTIAGSNLNVGGNLDANVGGSLNVLDRQDVTNTQSKSSESGFGTGGGIYGSKTTTVTDVDKKSVGSKINVGGNADIKAKDDVTLVGADVKIKGDGKIDATNINILEGRNEHTNTTVVQTSTFGVFTDSGGSASASASGSGGKGSGSGAASASASGEGDLTIGMRTKTSTTTTFDSTAVASTLQIGGNADLKAKDTITTRGSDVNIGGDLDMKAKDIKNLAAQDIHSTTTNSVTSTSGLSYAGSGTASASAQGNGSGNGSASGRGSASAEASGEASVGFKAQVNTTNESHTDTTARTSTFTVGGNMNRTAENKITDVGTQIDVGNNFTQSAKTIESLAAQNTSSSTFTSDTTTARLGLGAEGQVGGGGGGGTYGGGNGSGDASGTVGIKASVEQNSSSSSSSSSTAVVSNIKAGGSVTSTSKEETKMEGTNITAGKDVNLTASKLTYEAAKDTTSETSSDQNIKASVIGGLTTGGYGGNAKGAYDNANTSADSSKAVVGSITSGGNLNVNTTGDTKFVGTNLNSTGTTNINSGGDVKFEAARDTTSERSNNLAVEGKVSIEGKSSGVEGKFGMGKDSASTDNAVTSTITANGGLNINSGKSVTLEGAKVDSGNDVNITAKDKVNLLQATSTEKSSSLEASADLSVSGGKTKSGGKEGEGAIGGGFSNSDSTSNTATTTDITSIGKINIKSGSDTTLQGSNLNSTGKTSVDAGGNIVFKAKEESSTSSASSLDVNLSGSSKSGKDGGSGEKSGSGGISGGIAGEKTTTQTGGSINATGGIDLKSGKDTTLVGTQLQTDGKINVSAGGKVEQKDAVSTTVGGGFSTTIGGIQSRTDGTADREQVRPDNGVNLTPGTSVGLNLDSSRQQTTMDAKGGVIIQQNVKPSTSGSQVQAGSSVATKGAAVGSRTDVAGGDIQAAPKAGIAINAEPAAQVTATTATKAPTTAAKKDDAKQPAQKQPEQKPEEKKDGK